MRKLNLWIITGLLFLVAAFCVVLYNMNRTVEMGENSQEVIDQLDIEPETINHIFDPDKELQTTLINGNKYIGTIEMPEIGIKLPVMYDYELLYLEISPCRYSGTPYANDFIVCAHNSDTHFNKIRKLSMGSEIIFTDVEGNSFVYETNNIETLYPKQVDQLMEGDDWDLTLFTCNGFGESRCVVRANIKKINISE